MQRKKIKKNFFSNINLIFKNLYQNFLTNILNLRNSKKQNI